MKQLIRSAFLAVAASLLAAPALADEKVTLDQVPEKARRTIQAEVQDGKITEIEREKERDQTVYEVEYTTTAGANFEIDVGEDGTLLGKEQE